MAVFLCPECRKTVIRDAKEVGANVCPFCGGAMRVREPPPPLAEAVQTEPRPAPPAAARPAAPPRDKKPADRERPAGPPRRRRRRRKQRPSGWAEFFDYPTIIYLASTATVVFIWLVLVAVSLAAVPLGIPVIWYGVAVFVVGAGWLYVGALRDMDLPAISPGLGGGAGMGMLIGGCAFLVIILLLRLLLIVAYGVIYTITNPYAAWKAALLTLLGTFILISGVVLLALEV